MISKYVKTLTYKQLPYETALDVDNFISVYAESQSAANYCTHDSITGHLPWKNYTWLQKYVLFNPNSNNSIASLCRNGTMTLIPLGARKARLSTHLSRHLNDPRRDYQIVSKFVLISWPADVLRKCLELIENEKPRQDWSLECWNTLTNKLNSTGSTNKSNWLFSLKYTFLATEPHNYKATIYCYSQWHLRNLVIQKYNAVLFSFFL